MKILITGVAGFIGSNLAEVLIKKKDITQIIGIDNFDPYYSVQSKKENIVILQKNKKFCFYEVDILDSHIMDMVFEKHKPDVVVHLAAKVGVRNSLKCARDYQQVNCEGTLSILDCSKKYVVKKFIFASSGSVYGNQTKLPFSETTTVDSPLSPYAASKIAGELLCYTYAYLYQIPTICLRFFTVYGPKGRPDMIPYLFTKAILEDQQVTKYGSGESRRVYTYIDDIVQGISAAIDLDCSFEIINLGNDISVSLNAFIHQLEQITNKKLKIKWFPLHKSDVVQSYAANGKANRLLNYFPDISLQEGMERFITWYMRQRVINDEK